MSTTLKRNNRIDNLLDAQRRLLVAVKASGGTIKASEGRAIANALVANQSRRDSVWTTCINAGFLQPQGKGSYLLTDIGKLILRYWTRVDKAR